MAQRIKDIIKAMERAEGRGDFEKAGKLRRLLIKIYNNIEG